MITQKDVKREWEFTASQTGLKFKPHKKVSDPLVRIEGTYRRYKVYGEGELGGQYGPLYTELEIDLLTSPPFILRIFYKKRFRGKEKYILTNKEFFDKKGRKKIKVESVNVPTILTGNPEFDNTFGVIGDNQSKILGVLDRAMQEKLMSLKK
jgi:hypothetical protein